MLSQVLSRSIAFRAITFYIPHGRVVCIPCSDIDLHTFETKPSFRRTSNGLRDPIPDEKSEQYELPQEYQTA